MLKLYNFSNCKRWEKKLKSQKIPKITPFPSYLPLWCQTLKYCLELRKEKNGVSWFRVLPVYRRKWGLTILDFIPWNIQILLNRDEESLFSEDKTRNRPTKETSLTWMHKCSLFLKRCHLLLWIKIFFLKSERAKVYLTGPKAFCWFIMVFVSFPPCYMFEVQN